MMKTGRNVSWAPDSRPRCCTQNGFPELKTRGFLRFARALMWEGMAEMSEKFRELGSEGYVVET